MQLAATGLRELDQRSPAPPTDRLALTAALERARALTAENKSAEAQTILDALSELYRDDPAALELIRAAK